MRILLVGDSHGNDRFLGAVIDIAQTNDIDLLIQLGDFGFWPTSKSEESFAKWVDAQLKSAQLPMWVIDGNHDYLVEAYEFIHPNIFSFEAGLHYIPRGSVTEVEGLRLGFMGGAVSVDQEFRKPGISWWAEEVMNMDNLDLCRSNGPVDIWFTHDAVEIPPGRKPYDFGHKVNFAIERQRHMMRMAYDFLQPKLHIHGHWHYRYSCDGKYGRVYGLDYESKEALRLLEINDKEFMVLA